MHRVDLVAPKLHTHGQLHVGRVQVHDVTADRELARAVHLRAAGVPGVVQQRGQLGAGHSVAGVQRAGVAAKFRARGGVLGQTFIRHADGLQPPADDIAQHAQAAVLILAGRALDGAQHVVPRREDGGRHAQRVQVPGKAGGLGLAGGHDAQKPPRGSRQRGVDHRPAGTGQTE